MKRIALDTEVPGLDVYHDCKPFLVTVNDGIDPPIFWEWEVDPLTRQPQIIAEDKLDIIERIEEAGEVVFQNAKFDIAGLASIGIEWKEEWWSKVQDTLYSGHLLHSGEPHDLTFQARKYLGVDISPFEEALQAAVNEARAIARRDFPNWLIAREDMEGVPSAGKSKNKLWKCDFWLPRAVAIAKKYPKGECKVVNVKRSKFDVLIDRTTKWGNPFVIGKDGTRSEVVSKYRSHIQRQPWFRSSLIELDGKTLGCHCKPEDCHGDVLAEFVAELRHPWYAVLSEYACGDSLVTLPLYLEHLRLMKVKGLLPIYLEGRRMIRGIHKMEARGVTYSVDRLEELTTRFTEEASDAEAVCLALSDGKLDKLPKSGTTKAMRELLFDTWKLPVIKSGKTGPSADKVVLKTWESTLPFQSRPAAFIRNLLVNRSRETGLSYGNSYKRFGLPFAPGFRILHPSINATGTAHLRMSSSNPNEQNIGKQAETNLRYAFGPAPGREWWSIDYQNIELRLPAYEADEKEMVWLFEHPNDPPYFGSYHTLIFDTLHPEMFRQYGASVKTVFKDTWYQWTKNGNFAVQYGAMEISGTADRAYHVEGAQRRIQSRFAKIAELNQKQINHAERLGYVYTMPDREVGSYPIYCARSEWGNIIPTIPLNYHVSGTAMWCMRRAMVRCQEYIDTLPNHFIIMQVHDELVFDFPRGKFPAANLPKVKKLKALMEQSGDDVGVPLVASYSYHPNNWSKDVPVEETKAA